MENLSEDAFLGGKLTLLQPKSGYRAGADPVFLAAAVPANAGDTVLELGCGVGTALFCLMTRVPGLDATAVELNPFYADLARQNAELSGLTVDVHVADIADLPASLRSRSFDHVFTNPPYFDRASGSVAHDRGRETGRGETTDLATWVDAGMRRLAPGGTFTIIQRVERLPALLAAISDRLGGLTALPLAPRRGRTAKLALLQGRKGARGTFRLLPPFVLHQGDQHERDGDSYSKEAQAVLRDGEGLQLT